jgi:hypothetical protein
MRDRRFHERVPGAFQVCVTVVTNPELSASGETQEISKSGLGVFLPIPLAPGSQVRVDISDSVLYGFIAYSEQSESSAPSDTLPEGPLFHTGIDIVEVAMGISGLSQLLKTALDKALPNLRK